MRYGWVRLPWPRKDAAAWVSTFPWRGWSSRSDLISASGGNPVLAAATAEALPLDDGTFAGVVALDVIEHVEMPARVLSEMNRVTQAGGVAALSAPNRYSLAAEPHVSIWGVGFLPRRWQKSYVNFRTGFPYDWTNLLSVRQVRKLMAENTTFRIQVIIPGISENDIAYFSPRRALLARLYNRLIRIRGLRFLFEWLGAFFRMVGTKDH